MGPHLGDSFLPLKVRPPEAEDPLASYLTGLELFKEGAESLQFTPALTSNLNSPRGPWQPLSKHLTEILADATGMDSDLFCFVQILTGDRGPQGEAPVQLRAHNRSDLQEAAGLRRPAQDRHRQLTRSEVGPRQSSTSFAEGRTLPSVNTSVSSTSRSKHLKGRDHFLVTFVHFPESRQGLTRCRPPIHV